VLGNLSQNIGYLVQSKWIHGGSGEPDNGDIKELVAGIKDLFNLLFERFNDKIQAKRETAVRALTDTGELFWVCGMAAQDCGREEGAHDGADRCDCESEMA
jgi:hypothetical protein